MRISPTRSRLLLGWVLSAGAVGCSTTSSASHGDRERWKAELIQIDAAFSRAVQTRGVGEAFAAYAAENATMMPVGEPPAELRSARNSKVCLPRRR